MHGAINLYSEDSHELIAKLESSNFASGLPKKDEIDQENIDTFDIRKVKLDNTLDIIRNL